MTTPDDTNPESWHRFFAIEANNRAWALVEKPDRSPEEAAEMLDAAHAAALHWAKVGTELHGYRARTLLAEVHALLELPDALSLADDVRSYFQDRDTDDWEIAFVHAIHAHAAAVAGKDDVHRSSYAAAVAAIEAIADDEDRKIVRRTFDQVPVP